MSVVVSKAFNVHKPKKKTFSVRSLQLSFNCCSKHTFLLYVTIVLGFTLGQCAKRHLLLSIGWRWPTMVADLFDTKNSISDCSNRFSFSISIQHTISLLYLLPRYRYLTLHDRADYFWELFSFLLLF